MNFTATKEQVKLPRAEEAILNWGHALYKKNLKIVFQQKKLLKSIQEIKKIVKLHLYYNYR